MPKQSNKGVEAAENALRKFIRLVLFDSLIHFVSFHEMNSSGLVNLLCSAKLIENVYLLYFYLRLQLWNFNFV